MNCTLNSPECEIDTADSDEISVIDDTEPQEEIISEKYFMKWSDKYKSACDILYLEKDTETALELFKTEAQKGNVLASDYEDMRIEDASVKRHPPKTRKSQA